MRLSLGRTKQHIYSCYHLPDYGVLERYTQLDDTLGVLDMETKSFERVKLWSWIFFPSWIALTGIQIFCYTMYNDTFHPLAKIVDDTQRNTLNYLQDPR